MDLHLEKKHYEFIQKEFGVSEKEFNEMNEDEIGEIWDVCEEIRVVAVDDAYDAGEYSLSERGEIARQIAYLLDPLFFDDIREAREAINATAHVA